MMTAMITAHDMAPTQRLANFDIRPPEPVGQHERSRHRGGWRGRSKKREGMAVSAVPGRVCWNQRDQQERGVVPSTSGVTGTRTETRHPGSEPADPGFRAGAPTRAADVLAELRNGTPESLDVVVASA